MSRELFEDILSKIKGNSEFLYFHVMGEPLLHPEISTFLDLCHQYGYRVNITTNGTLIEEIGDSIVFKPALRQVNFSLHSFEANINEYSMACYLNKIFKFIKRSREKSDLLICLRLWNITEEGKNDKNRFVLQQIESEFGLDFKLEDKLTPTCKGIKLGDNVFLNQASVFNWPDNELEDIDCKGFCYGLRDQVAILVDGTVVP
jgi:organic radical activating enzyme